ncbi:MAG: hypothetical protein ACYTGC_02740 [Planctomycetota bacterium]|jgi:hypothetical protein
MRSCRKCINQVSWGVSASALLLSAGGVFGLAGCSNQPKVVPERTEVTRAFSPEWYEETPRGDDKSIYKTAQGVGVNPGIAESVAINQARQEMALSIEARVDVLQRNFQEQIEAAGDLDLLQRFQDLNTIIASKTLHGSHVVRKETYLEPDGTYRTFVLMELDGREVDANMLESLREMDELETRLRSSEAWAELERRARELRQERRGDFGPMTDEQIRGDG